MSHLTLSNLFAPSAPHINNSSLTALLRLDLNMGIHDNVISDDTRLVRSLPTIHELIARNAKVVILSHFGRPIGTPDPRFSLIPIALNLRKYVTCPILFSTDCIGPSAKTAIEEACPGSIIILENLRFHEGEETNTSEFSSQLAILGDVYINDAFSCSHRAHASIVGLPKLLPAYAGRALEAELTALEGILHHPQRPIMTIVGGAKISTKLDLLKNLVTKMDYLVLGGGMANTFLAAKGIPVGNSLMEESLIDAAKTIMSLAEAHGCVLILPSDVVVSTSLKDKFVRTIILDQLSPADCIFDVGPDTLNHIESIMDSCKTVLWNGPLGVFEIPPYDASSHRLAQMIAARTEKGLISVAGGGDTLAALHTARSEDGFTHTSTAGGAFLEWLEGKVLPGISALQN